MNPEVISSAGLKISLPPRPQAKAELTDADKTLIRTVLITRTVQLETRINAHHAPSDIAELDRLNDVVAKCYQGAL